MKSLVIVESPTKARTISKFLGQDFDIKFSMGHIMDLPKSRMAIDIENDFTPQYEVIADKKKLISELKSLAEKADSIVLATDPDREGEAIASHIKEVLVKNQKSKIKEQKFKRVVFHEITKDAIAEAFKHPRGVDENLVDAQTARRVLDRLVGYELSPVLWRKVRRGLSAGRVQSVALRMIVEREREIENFAKSKYFTIHALLNKQKVISNKQQEETEFELFEINGKKIESKETISLYDGEYTFSKTTINKKEEAEKIVAELNNSDFKVSGVTSRQSKRSPLPPYTTSTLQQDASRRFGLSGKRTMSLAQKLYEEGFITYHRTDSIAISNQAIKMIRNFAEKEFGSKYLPSGPRVFKGKQKNAQEAHEAIRITDVNRQLSDVSGVLGADYAKLYGLIWNKAVASQMADALIESTSVVVDSFSKNHESGTKDDYKLRAAGSVLLFDGFLRLTPEALKDNKLPKFESGELLNKKDIFSTPHETAPPPRYNDASLIKTLEEKGIGRPSTYASIISTLTDRSYIERVEKRFEPTPIGASVNDFLVLNFANIDDIPFTAEMEENLDAVAGGKKQWEVMMKDFYGPFKENIKKAEGSDRVAIAVEQTNESCPECGKPLIIRHGKFGKFFSCSGFPDCKFTKSFTEETDVLCPKDGGKVIIRKTRKGRKFYGCANYPKCEFAAWKLEDVKQNPKGKNQNAKGE